MSDLRIFNGDGKRAEDITGEMAKRVKALIYEYDGRTTLAAALGVLQIVATEILAEQVR